MTAGADPIRATSRPVRRAVAFALALSPLVVITFAVAFSAGYAALHDGRVMPGVAVAGVPLAGLDRRAAEAELRRVLPDLRTGRLTIRVADTEQAISYVDVARDYDMDGMIAQALSAGRGAGPLDQPTVQVQTLLDGYTIPAVVTWDASALADRVRAAVTAAERLPINASVTRSDGVYAAIPGVPGRVVDADRAAKLAAAAIDNLSSADTTVDVESTPVAPRVPTEQAQAAVDRVTRVSSTPLAVAAAETMTMIDTQTIRGWLSLVESEPGIWGVVLDEQSIRAFVDGFKSQVDEAAVDGTYTFSPGGEPLVVPAVTGRALDQQGALDAIVTALRARVGGDSGSTVTLDFSSVAPNVTTEQAAALAARVERLSSWTTLYESSSRNGFGVNIRRPTSLIDGAVIEPGAVFDFVAIAGPITEANGYSDGAAIINGKSRLAGVLGGGLCSASTTIFNAGLRAGFQIDARRAHAYYIDRYPVGLDATVWINGDYVQTVAFTNDSPYPILIRGINRPGRVTYEIYGVPDGRRVSLSEPQVWDERKAWTEIEYTDDLAPGETERVEYPFDGFSSSVDRTVTDASGNVLHQDTFRSSYRQVIGLILVGRSAGDPPAGTRVVAGAAQ